MKTITFDSSPAGMPPEGWTATQTGAGTARWTVVEDDTAPSKPNVLKQSGQATYPVCLKDGTSIKDKPIGVADLFCSFCQALKINPRKENLSTEGRPLKIVDGGKVVKELF